MNFLNLLLFMVIFIVLLVVIPFWVMGYRFVAGKFVYSVFSAFIIGYFTLVTVVYVLSFLRIINRITLAITLLMVIVCYRLWRSRRELSGIYNHRMQTASLLLKGIYRPGMMLSAACAGKGRAVFAFVKEECRSPIKVMLLLTGMIYGVYIRCYHCIHHSFFGMSDAYVHIQWISNIESDGVFSSGVYPFGMHNVCYAVAALSGLDIVTVIQYMGGVNSLFMLLGCYLFLKAILRWETAAALGMAISAGTAVIANLQISRQGNAVPQELALVFVLPAVAYLKEYLENKDKKALLYFTLAAVLCLSTHIYAGIILFLYCVVTLFLYLRKIVTEKGYIKSLTQAVVIIVFLTFAPFIAGLAQGKGWEPSIGWALSVMQEDAGEEPDSEPVQSENASNMLAYYEAAFAEDEYTVVWFVAHLFCAAIVFLVAVLYLCSRSKAGKAYARGCLSFVLICMVMNGLMFLPYFGLPEIVERNRAGSIATINMALLFAVPIDMLVVKICKNGGLLTGNIAFAAITAGIAGLLVSAGQIAGPGYAFQSQYDGAYTAYYKIRKEHTDGTWTIVSPVDENAFVYGKGYHYELSEFIIKQESNQETAEQELVIPTKYIFFYLEKTPLETDRVWWYDQEAPENEPYLTVADARYDLWTEMQHYEAEDNYLYTNLKLRRILEAKLGIWLAEYQQYHGGELTLFYEDDEIAVYKLIQDQFFYNNLFVDCSETKEFPRELQAVLK